jgi:Periplasmic binding protein
MRTRHVIVTVVVFAVLGACGSSSGGKKSASPPTTVVALSGTPGPGVTADAVKVGVMMIDYKCIEQFVDEERPDQKKTYQIFIDDLNKNGGINGRKIVPVYKTFCPIDTATEIAACTSLTDDEKVFATIGTFYDPNGQAQQCFTKRHKTPIVSSSFPQALAAKTPGMMVTPDISPERRLNVIMALLKGQNTLNGKKVGTVASAANAPRVEKVVKPGLTDMKVERGADATLTIVGDDTTSAQTQLDSFIDEWKQDHTNALIMVGEDVASKQFVEKIKAAIPDMLLIADTTSILDAGREEQKAHKSPNPYDGAMSAEGQTGLEHTETDHFKYCSGIWTKATGKPAPSPNEVVKLPNGKENDVYGDMEDACLYTNFFATIARKVGPALNAANWVQTVDNFGPIDDMSTIYASLHKDKYDADDTYGLVAYDPTIPQVGDWRHVTPVQNVSGG